MTTDEQMTALVRAWLHGTATSRRTASRTVSEVMSRLPQTHQRGRWWPLPGLGRRVDRALGDTARQPTANGLQIHPLPIVTRRTVTMLSPVKAIIAGGLVFALGGVLLVAQPFDEQRAAVPGASVADPPDTVVVTATQDCALISSPVHCTYAASDPRVTGSGGHVFTDVVTAQAESGGLGSEVGAYWADAWIEGPEGDWTGHIYLVGNRGIGPVDTLMMLAGDGAYEGWSFIAFGPDPEADADQELTGLLYQGPLPPVGQVAIPAGG